MGIDALGALRTDDIISWELLPCARAPDEVYDAGGYFSGSALETEKGHVLMYTEVMLETDADGLSRMRQQQAIAIGDGETYHKLADNPVITSDMLPEGCSREDFRGSKDLERERPILCVDGEPFRDRWGTSVALYFGGFGALELCIGI